jgi:hypothetical protein
LTDEYPPAVSQILLIPHHLNKCMAVGSVYLVVPNNDAFHRTKFVEDW